MNSTRSFQLAASTADPSRLRCKAAAIGGAIALASALVLASPLSAWHATPPGTRSGVTVSLADGGFPPPQPGGNIKGGSETGCCAGGG
jgi:hypothetical protein